MTPPERFERVAETLMVAYAAFARRPGRLAEASCLSSSPAAMAFCNVLDDARQLLLVLGEDARFALRKFNAPNEEHTGAVRSLTRHLPNPVLLGFARTILRNLDVLGVLEQQLLGLELLCCFCAPSQGPLRLFGY
jgi:hypothetical protein